MTAGSPPPGPAEAARPTGRTLWLDPRFGASGDMVLGALLAVGAPLAAVVDDLGRLAGSSSVALDPGHWSIGVEDVGRAGLSATRAVVTTVDDGQHHRPWSAIDQLLATSELPPPVAVGARATFAALARVEAGIHGVEVDEVHFHEVGALDAIVDVVGVWSARHHLGLDAVVAGPVGLGTGSTPSSHGLLPLPAPATLALLEGVPVRPVEVEAETVTPTGAALLATLVTDWGPIPAGRLGSTGRGAGGRDPATHPNVVTAVLIEGGRPSDRPATDDVGTPTTDVEAVVLATNVDDVTPEVLGRTLARLLAEGADDAWLVPVTMKKSRPGHELRVLARPELASRLRHVVFAETGTLGIRAATVTKHVADRSSTSVEVRGHRIGIKTGPHGAKPEHDDLVAASEATGTPIRELAIEAVRAAAGAPGDPPRGPGGPGRPQWSR